MYRIHGREHIFVWLLFIKVNIFWHWSEILPIHHLNTSTYTTAYLEYDWGKNHSYFIATKTITSIWMFCMQYVAHKSKFLFSRKTWIINWCYFEYIFREKKCMPSNINDKNIDVYIHFPQFFSRSNSLGFSLYLSLSSHHFLFLLLISL